MKMRVIKEGGHPINGWTPAAQPTSRRGLPARRIRARHGGDGAGPAIRRLGDLVAGTIVVVEIGSHAGGPIFCAASDPRGARGDAGHGAPVPAETRGARPVRAAARSTLTRACGRARGARVARASPIASPAGEHLHRRGASRSCTAGHRASERVTRMAAQDQFVAARKAEWTELDELLARAVALHQLSAVSISRVAALYRIVCADLMRARAAGYDVELLAHLDRLAASTHNMLYGARPVRSARSADLSRREFRGRLRANARFFAIASALFFVPLVLALAPRSCIPHCDRCAAAGQCSTPRGSYAEQLEGRDQGKDASMAASTSTTTSASPSASSRTGILFGLESVFFLVYNGVVIGATIGWVIAQGRHEHPDVRVHARAVRAHRDSASAGRGPADGLLVVRTNGRTRLGSLRAQAGTVGTSSRARQFMLLVAAAIEAFGRRAASLATSSGRPRRALGRRRGIPRLRRARCSDGGRREPRRSPRRAASAHGGRGARPPRRGCFTADRRLYARSLASSRCRRSRRASARAGGASGRGRRCGYSR